MTDRAYPVPGYTLPDWWPSKSALSDDDDASDWPRWHVFKAERARNGRWCGGPIAFAYPILPNFGFYCVLPQ